jgi:hypothetical protein
LTEEKVGNVVWLACGDKSAATTKSSYSIGPFSEIEINPYPKPGCF